MKKVFKKVLAVVMAIALTLTMLPTNSYAEGTSSTPRQTGKTFTVYYYLVSDKTNPSYYAKDAAIPANYSSTADNNYYNIGSFTVEELEGFELSKLNSKSVDSTKAFEAYKLQLLNAISNNKINVDNSGNAISARKQAIQAMKDAITNNAIFSGTMHGGHDGANEMKSSTGNADTIHIHMTDPAYDVRFSFRGEAPTGVTAPTTSRYAAGKSIPVSQLPKFDAVQGWEFLGWYMPNAQNPIQNNITITENLALEGVWRQTHKDVYVYIKPANISEDARRGATLNGSGYFTLGKLSNVALTPNPAQNQEEGIEYFEENVDAISVSFENIEAYTGGSNEHDKWVEAAIAAIKAQMAKSNKKLVMPYGTLLEANGANDYVPSGTRTMHLDLGVDGDFWHTVTYTAGEGTGEKVEEGNMPTNFDYTVKNNSELLGNGQPAFTKENHIFDGWKIGDDKIAAGKIITMSKNITLVAQWKPINHKVLFTADANGTLEGDTEFEVLNNTEGSTIQFPTPVANEGYYFAGWDNTMPEHITESIEIKAQFAAKNEIVITLPSDSKEYNGEDQKFEQEISEEVGINGVTYKVVGLTAIGNGKNVGNHTITSSGSAIVYNGVLDVTEQFTVKVTEGQLTINKKPVTITVASQTKPFGTSDVAATAALSGDVNNELSLIDLSVRRSDAGNEDLGLHKDVLVINSTKEQLEAAYTNYTFEIVPGSLTIVENVDGLYFTNLISIDTVEDGNTHTVGATANLEAATIEYEVDGEWTTVAPSSSTPIDETYNVRARLEGYKTAEATVSLKITAKPAEEEEEQQDPVDDGEDKDPVDDGEDKDPVDPVDPGKDNDGNDDDGIGGGSDDDTTITDDEVPGGEVVEPQPEDNADENSGETTTEEGSVETEPTIEGNDDAELDDEEVPAGELPYTGGVTSAILYGLGSAAIALGAFIGRKKSEDSEENDEE